MSVQLRVHAIDLILTEAASHRAPITKSIHLCQADSPGDALTAMRGSRNMNTTVAIQDQMHSDASSAEMGAMPPTR